METLARLIIALVRRGSLETARRWGGRLGRLGYFLSWPRRRVALANLDLAYGDSLSRQQKFQIAKTSFENLVTTAFEFIYTPNLPADIHQVVELVDIHNFWEAFNRGKGVIAVVPHMGNWELISRFFPWAGVEAHAVTRKQRQPWVTRLVSEIRAANGLHEIDKRDALKPVLAALRRGEVVCILIDQHAKKDAVETTFFGHTAMTVGSVALLSLRTGCSVIVAGSRRLVDGSISVKVSDVIETVDTGDRDADIQVNTQNYVDVMEGMVRESPGSWMWMHRRWR